MRKTGSSLLYSGCYVVRSDSDLPCGQAVDQGVELEGLHIITRSPQVIHKGFRAQSAACLEACGKRKKTTAGNMKQRPWASRSWPLEVFTHSRDLENRGEQYCLRELLSSSARENGEDVPVGQVK